MGFWSKAKRIATGTAVLTGKAVVGTAKVAGKGVAAAAKTAYEHREGIADTARTAVKVATTTVGTASHVAYKAGEWAVTKVVDNREGIARVAGATAKVATRAAVAVGSAAHGATKFGVEKVVENREVIGGVAVGTARGVGKAIADTSAHAFAGKRAEKPLLERIADQSAEYRRQIRRLYGRLERTHPSVTRRQALFDSTVVGGNTLATYSTHFASVPPDIERAYSLAYPDLAEKKSFIQEVQSLNADSIPGFVAGVKGKLFEMKYVDYLNDGNLPSGYHAKLAGSATQPAWDIAVTGPDGQLNRVIQAKATESLDYVRDALERYPHIDVVTTEEVHSQLVMQGFADNVIDSGISENAIQEMVEGATDGAAMQFSWAPSAVSLALIAFSAYSREGLDAYQKSRNFGERSVRSYLAYLAGGALAVATSTWWIGVMGGIGTRLMMGSGGAKRSRLQSLKQLVASNDRLLLKLQSQR